MAITVVTRSEEETEALARRLATQLRAGDVIRLSGELGAGKTAFVRGLAEGLGVDPDEVSSPTFTLVHEYRGRLPLFHADLYRLSPAATSDLGLLGVETESGVLAVEWPDRLHELVGGAIDVVIESVDDTTRRIHISGPDLGLSDAGFFGQRTQS